jgi:GNAT superfamily N-acetyltransferase
MEFGSQRIAFDKSRVVTFRPANTADDQFLLGVYGSTRLEELALTNWDEAQREAFVRMQFNAQQAHYRQHYPEGEHLIILCGEEPVGRLYVAEIKNEIRIIDVTIRPEYRNGQIGTRIIERLMEEAARIGKPLTIYVETFNPSYRLFERLGFMKTGESGYSHLLEWRASSAEP